MCRRYSIYSYQVESRFLAAPSGPSLSHRLFASSTSASSSRPVRPLRPPSPSERRARAISLCLSPVRGMLRAAAAAAALHRRERRPAGVGGDDAIGVAPPAGQPESRNDDPRHTPGSSRRSPLSPEGESVWRARAILSSPSLSSSLSLSLSRSLARSLFDATICLSLYLRYSVISNNLNANIYLLCYCVIIYYLINYYCFSCINFS